MDAQENIEDTKAWAQQMKAIYTQQQPTGVRFVDGFNAVLRPLTALLIMILFLCTAGLFVWGVLQDMLRGDLVPQDAAEIIWGSLVGEAIQAVLGFLFGYRSSRRVSWTR